MEPGVHIIDLMAYLRMILKHWRRILLCGVVFAVLFAGFSWFQHRNSRNQGTDGDTEPANPLLLELQLIERSLDNKNRYIQNSGLLQLDPNAVSRANIRFSIHTAEMDLPGEASSEITIDAADPVPGAAPETSVDVNSADFSTRRALLILQYYINALNFSLDLNALSSSLGMDDVYIRELLSCVTDTGDTISARIQAVYFDEEHASQMVQFAADYLDEVREDAIRLYGAHELIVEPVMVRTSADRSYNTFFKDRLQEVNDLKTQKDNFEKNFSVSQGGGEKASAGKLSRKTLVKKGIAGALFGIFLAAALACFSLIIRGVIVSPAELSIGLGLQKLALIPDSAERRGIDKMIAGLGRKGTSADPEVCRKIAGANLREQLSGIGGASRIALVADPEAGSMEALRKSLEEEAAETGCRSVSLVSNLSMEPDALKELALCDAAVIAVSCGSSRKKTVMEYVSSVKAYKKNILGFICCD